MFTTSYVWPKPLLVAVVLVAFGSSFGAEDVFAQRQGQYQQSEQGDFFIHGISLGIGLAIYQGDFTRNPNHNIIKYIAGNGHLSAQVGADHRFGRYDQVGVGLDVSYTRISEKTTEQRGFKSNIVAVDAVVDYELPYIKQGLFRFFIGGGPYIILDPSYDNFPEQERGERWQQLGTRAIGSVKVGVTILDGFQIGTRIATSDLVDGYKGYNPDGLPDFISFLRLRYRFDTR